MQNTVISHPLSEKLGKNSIDLNFITVPIFETVIRSLRSISIPGKSIAESLFISETITKKTKFLPQLSSHPIFKDLLLTSRNLETNLASQLFENLVLGNEVFTQALGSQPLIDSPSYLEKFDKPLLNTAKTREILALQGNGSISAVVCTSRPSSAPRGMNGSNGYFLPEVEIGLAQAGMEQIPFIGWGGILALAREKGDQPDNLLKPQPVQLLASIPVALGVEQSVALRWAYDVWMFSMKQNGGSARKAENSFALPSNISLHIFEDLTTGLVAGKQAAEILATLQINVDLHLWGITQDKMKSKALRNVGAKVFPDVNVAVGKALDMEKLNED